MRSRAFTRTVLLLLAAGQLVTGIWAIAAPESFFTGFPGTGVAWAPAGGPFNLHLVIDSGAGFLATGVALLIAAVWLRRSAVIVALAAYLAHALPHTGFHLSGATPALPAPDQAASVVSLVAGVVAAAVLLVVAAGDPERPAGRGPAMSTNGDAAVAPLAGSPRGLVLKVAFAAARRRVGAVPMSWRILGRRPALAIARIAGDAAHRRSSVVPARLAALAMLRTAVLVECAFCIDILSAGSFGEGARPEQLRDVTRWRDSDAFDADERLVLALADAMTQTPAVVPDDLRAACVARFGEEGVIELAAFVGHENARARANRALGVEPQGFAAAAGCPLPQRAPA